jgi:hypothetical protein
LGAVRPDAYVGPRLGGAFVALAVYLTIQAVLVLVTG